MAKIDDVPNPDNLNVPDEGAAGAEPAAELDAAVLTEAEPADVVSLADAIKQEPEQERQQEEQEEKEPEEKKPSKLLLYLPTAAAIGLPVVALAAAFLAVTYYSAEAIPAVSTAIYAIALGYIPLSLWAGRKTNTLYVVLLGCVLAAVLTAVYCLWMVLARYKFDIKAQEAKQRVGMVLPSHPQGNLPADAGSWQPNNMLG